MAYVTEEPDDGKLSCPAEGVPAVGQVTAPPTGAQPTAYTRREQRYLAVVSPSAFWRLLPVTGGG
jgi:hypothetical protein